MSGLGKAINVVILGTAGSGKTTLVSRFGRWLTESCHYRVGYVNLDPACLEIPFDPSFDIRSMFTTNEIMVREKLGPNAAIVRCSDLMAEKADGIANSIANLDADFRLIDTPGQTEIFVFRDSGPRIMKALSRREYTISIMLFDKTLTATPIDIATAQLMTLVVQLRIGIPMITTVSKSELSVNQDIDKLLSNQVLLAEAIQREWKEGGAYKDMSLELPSLIKAFKAPIRIIATSAMTGKGFDDLLDIINETYCACGDLT
jgi:GTPase SAR1 family protein